MKKALLLTLAVLLLFALSGCSGGVNENAQNGSTSTSMEVYNDSYAGEKIKTDTLQAVAQVTLDVTANSGDFALDITDAITPSPTPEIIPPTQQSTILPTATPDMLKVDIFVSLDIEDGRPIVSVQTNLPDGMPLFFMVYRYFTGGYYFAEGRGEVQNGLSSSKPTPEKRSILSPGEYTVEVYNHNPHIIPQNVLDIIGSYGQYMEGESIEYDDITDFNAVNVIKTFTVK